MTDEQIAALRAAAEKATPGPWEMETNAKCPDVLCPDGLIVVNTSGSDMFASCDVVNAAYIALANPAAVLALLDRVTAAERVAIATREACAVAAFNEVNACREDADTDLRSVRERVADAVLASPPATLASAATVDAVAQEREAIASMFDDIAARKERAGWSGVVSSNAREYAAAIRARGRSASA